MTKEERKVYMKAYNKANLDKMNAWRKAYYAANPEKINAKHKAYYDANPEKIKARHKAYREANPEKMKEWCRACNIVSRDRLSRGYIATRLHIPVASLSPEMEEQKRMQLKITRTINQLRKTI